VIGRRGAALAALAAAGLTASAAPAAAAPSYADANASYQAGAWRDAVTQYEALVAAGVVHPDLFYNLGNAYFRCAAVGECEAGLGRAVYNYERALRLDPGFADARDNLALARETVAGKWADRLKEAEEDPLWIRIATFLAVGPLAVVFLILDLLFFGGMTATRFLATGLARTALRVANAFSGLALACVGLLLVMHIYFLERVELGVVLVDRLQMREGTDERAAERAEIHAGLRVEILDREDGWMRIELANGHEGWVPADAIGAL
jgi:hypothetical protein